VHDPAQGTLNLFLLNRNLAEETALTVSARGFGGLELESAVELQDDELDAVNTRDDAERIKPGRLDGIKIDGETISLRLAPASWNVVSLHTR
jgi:alpha-N-arabinofuranosidase